MSVLPSIVLHVPIGQFRPNCRERTSSIGDSLLRVGEPVGFDTQKMNMEVKEEGRRLVRPAGLDNEDALRYHNHIIPVSSSDLAIDEMHVPVVYAFNAPAAPTALLERGLAKALGLYREWAGRLIRQHNGRPAILLNDEGAIFIEATAGVALADAMPYIMYMQLTPPTRKGISELLFVQLTRFTCGGLVLGIARHHIVSDGVAVTIFMNSWGKIVRGEPVNRPPPVYDRSVLMARDPPNPTYDHGEIYKSRPKERMLKDDMAAKRIHFSAEFLKELKRNASGGAEHNGDQRPYSRFECLVAHLWRCISKARGLPQEIITRTRFSVNGRRRLNPPIPLEYLGNVLFSTCAEASVRELVERPIPFAATLIHEAIPKVHNEYMRSALDFLELGLHRIDAAPGALNGNDTGAEWVNFLAYDWKPTSWLNFPIYDLDFGWGNPFYVGPQRDLLTVEGYAVFVPSGARDGGIDVDMALLKPHMAILEQICYSI